MAIGLSYSSAVFQPDFFSQTSKAPRAMNNLFGIALILAAMAAFAVEDMFIKLMAERMPTGQVILILGLAGSLVFLIGLAITRERFLRPEAWSRVPLWRAVCEGLAAMAFVSSLSLVDLSVVAAVFQAVPLAVTLGAALFLGESVGWRRWTAISVGFLGVILIIRPGTSAFDPNTILVLIAVFFVAIRDLITRFVPKVTGTMTISLQAFGSTIITGTILMLVMGETPVTPDTREAGFIIGAAIFGTAGVYGIIHAMRVAEASAVQPFRYARLIFSMVVGMIVFAERPDAMTYVGSALIIASGLYTFFRERALSKAAARA